MKTPALTQRNIWWLAAVILSLTIAGCATPEQAVPGARADLLAFLQDGVTTRGAVILQLGQPSATLEKEQILTYRIGEDVKNNHYIVSGSQFAGAVRWESARYSLVLVFTAEGVLQKHNLVLVK